jgi:hypothetical protein
LLEFTVTFGKEMPYFLKKRQNGADELTQVCTILNGYKPPHQRDGGALRTPRGKPGAFWMRGSGETWDVCGRNWAWRNSQ